MIVAPYPTGSEEHPAQYVEIGIPSYFGGVIVLSLRQAAILIAGLESVLGRFCRAHREAHGDFKCLKCGMVDDRYRGACRCSFCNGIVYPVGGGTDGGSA